MLYIELWRHFLYFVDLITICYFIYRFISTRKQFYNILSLFMYSLHLLLLSIRLNQFPIIIFVNTSRTILLNILFLNKLQFPQHFIALFHIFMTLFLTFMTIFTLLSCVIRGRALNFSLKTCWFNKILQTTFHILKGFILILTVKITVIHVDIFNCNSIVLLWLPIILFPICLYE